MEPSLKKFGVFFAIAFIVLFSLFGVKQVYVVGNRSEGMASTFPILLIASLILAAALNAWFDKIVSRIKGRDKDAGDL